jgi:cyclopropane fatty-acyl-phospholipid synthase-like methyltransferase
MSFEKPDFGVEPSKIEQEPLSPHFLEEQIRLTEAEWDKRFHQLIEEKIRESERGPVDEPEATPEIVREQTFKRYIEGLGLNVEQLQGRKVLDLGSGEGEFVQYLIERGITREAYGVDAELDENSVETNLKDHLVRGNFEEDLPIKDVDYVVSVGAVSLGVTGGEEIMNIQQIVKKSLASLKEGGEIRIYPIQEAAKATPAEGLVQSRRKWEELMSVISQEQDVEYKIEPRDVKVSGKDNDIFLNSVLIIRKRKD